MRPAERALAVWAALLLLLAATAGSAFLPLGPWNAAINLAIAVAKAGLVAVFFMHLRDARGLIRLAGAVAVFLLVILFGLGAADYLNRRVYPAPWQLPTTLDHRSH
ncbi:MAG: cytochrome C oxidase subunit IV family protein [Actinomycetota bacterium]